MSDHPASKPTRKRRWTVRRLMLWIAVLAVLMALLRQPFLYVRSVQHFTTQLRHGHELISSYKRHNPPGIPAACWNDGVDMVGTAWANMVFTKDSVDRHELDAIIAWLTAQAAAATPATAEGDLYALMDRLAQARPPSQASYVSLIRYYMKVNWHAGKPSPALVADTLRRLGNDATRPLDSLAEAARSGTTLQRIAALRALSHHGQVADGPEAAAIMLAALQDPERYVRFEAFEGLEALGPAAAPGMRVLELIARAGPDDPSRTQAIVVLGAIGPQASPAVPTLLAALNDPLEHIRAAAASALAEIGLPPAEALPLWTRLLGTELRYVAITALNRMGADAAPALPQLRAAAQESNGIYQAQLDGAIAAIEAAQAAAATNSSPP